MSCWELLEKRVTEADIFDRMQLSSVWESDKKQDLNKTVTVILETKLRACGDYFDCKINRY